MNEESCKRVMCGFLSCLQMVLPCFLLLLTSRQIFGCPSECQLCSERQASCRDLGLTTFPNNFSASTTLIYLSGNKISNLNQNEMRNLQQLAVLYLDNAGVSDVYPKAFVHLKKLCYLHLNNNQITRLDPGIFEELFNLNYLYLQFNKISYLPPGVFGNLAAVRYLTLQGNQLSFVGRKAFMGMINLQRLNLANNNISRIAKSTFNNLPHLEHLYLESNNLSYIPPIHFEKLKNLKQLFLSHNPIKSLPPFAFRGLDRLQYLFLENAKIKDIRKNAFVGLNNLKHLMLRNNNLGTITSTMFSSLGKLNYLQLDRNNIVNIEENAFENTGGFLKVLHLAYNNLTGLKPKVFQPLVSLTHLQASHNPWICNCNSLKLYNLLQLSSVTVYINCQKPPKLSGRPLRNIKWSEFEDCISISPKETKEIDADNAVGPTVRAWFEFITQRYSSPHLEYVAIHSAPYTLEIPTFSSTEPLVERSMGSNVVKTTVPSTLQIPAQFSPANFTMDLKSDSTQDSTPVFLPSMRICQEEFDKVSQAFDILLGLFVVACFVILFLIIKVVQYRQKLKTLENSGEILEYYSCYQSASYSVPGSVQIPPQNLIRNQNSDQIRLIKPPLAESQAQVILFEHSVL